MCFLLIAYGLVRMLGASCAVCNNLLFLHSFNNLSLIFAYYSSAISSCIRSETASVAVNGRLYKFCLYGAYVHFGFSLTPSIVNVQLLTKLNECTHLSKFTTPTLLMCLEIHTSQWCFYRRAFFENTGLNSFFVAEVSDKKPQGEFSPVNISF